MVAGDRVTTDVVAVPFSKARNLLSPSRLPVKVPAQKGHVILLPSIEASLTPSEPAFLVHTLLLAHLNLSPSSVAVTTVPAKFMLSLAGGEKVPEVPALE